METEENKYSWFRPGAKVTIMLGCIALIATMVLYDGLRNGETLRPLAGAAVAVLFWMFVFKGIPIPEQVANGFREQLGRAMSLQVGATSGGFRWIMVVLGVVMAAGTVLCIYAILFASPEDIELFIPVLGRTIRQAESHDAGMLVRFAYAAVFSGAAYAMLLTAWTRARE